MKKLLLVFLGTNLMAMNFTRVRCTAEDTLLTFFPAYGSSGALLSYEEKSITLQADAKHLVLSLHKDIGVTLTARVLELEFDTLKIFFDKNIPETKNPYRTLLKFFNNGQVVSTKLLDCVAYKE